jgi:hypothetical protein
MQRIITSKRLTEEYNEWVLKYDDSKNEAGQYFGQYLSGKYDIRAGNSYWLEDPFEVLTEIITEAPRGAIIY